MDSNFPVATRADLLRRPGLSQLSGAAHDKAIELAGNNAEAAYLYIGVIKAD